ncbi:MAG: hypothetical protein K940chlam3_01448 [Chlamydiae bacterium]|nr:hypothetical protein [Chlamydiota bacterium]
MAKREHYFYDKAILADRETEHVNKLLEKYKHEKVDEDLKKKIWEELQHEKHLGNISIPFKIVLRRDEYGKYPDTIEVILDTKL